MLGSAPPTMDRSAYDRWWRLEQKHFWRVGKRELMLELFDRELGSWSRPDRRRILDIGGACTILTRELGRFGDVTMVEPDEQTAAFARETLGLPVHVGRLPDGMPDVGTFDAITMFDVIEHIEDADAAMRKVHDLLREDGVLLLTVPALMLLWSDHDVANHHFRRYHKPELDGLLRRTGFRIDRISYFTSLLFPLIAAQRLAMRARGVKEKAEYNVEVPLAPLNRALYLAMSLERRLLRSVDMPIGSSLVALCRKQ